MSTGLPVIVTRVGGLPEAAAAYGGAIFVPPRDSNAILAALVRALPLAGRRFANPHSWDASVTRLEQLFAMLPARRQTEASRVISYEDPDDPVGEAADGGSTSRVN